MRSYCSWYIQCFFWEGWQCSGIRYGWWSKTFCKYELYTIKGDFYGLGVMSKNITCFTITQFFHYCVSSHGRNLKGKGKMMCLIWELILLIVHCLLSWLYRLNVKDGMIVEKCATRICVLRSSQTYPGRTTKGLADVLGRKCIGSLFVLFL